MKRRIPLVASAIVLAVAPALAVSPADQYATFARDNEAITDTHTKLVWQRGNGPQMPWSAAKAYCATLSLARAPGGPPLTGFRPPTYKELLTLVDENPSVESENGVFVTKAIDANAFPHTPAAYFWTDSVSWTDSVNPSGQPTKAWRIDFEKGDSILEPMSSAQYVRCVRDDP